MIEGHTGDLELATALGRMNRRWSEITQKRHDGEATVTKVKQMLSGRAAAATRVDIHRIDICTTVSVDHRERKLSEFDGSNEFVVVRRRQNETVNQSVSNPERLVVNQAGNKGEIGAELVANFRDARQERGK